MVCSCMYGMYIPAAKTSAGERGYATSSWHEMQFLCMRRERETERDRERHRERERERERQTERERETETERQRGREI